MAFDLNNILDSSSNVAHGTIGGQTPPTVVASPWGFNAGAVAFASGQNQSAALPAASLTLPVGDFTVDVRVKRTRSGVTEVVFSRWGTTPAGASDYLFLFYIDVDDKPKAIVATSASTLVVVASSATITDTAAHAIRLVKASGNLHLYLDGTRVAGPTACAAPWTGANAGTPWRLADYDDETSLTGVPFLGTLGELIVSNIARTSAASYTVPVVAATTDANTLLLWHCDKLSGNYLLGWSAPTNILLRSATASASGGWANPDGPFTGLDGHLYLSASAFDGTNWSVWAAGSSNDKITGTWTLTSAVALQPSGDHLNGTILPWSGTYYHWGQNLAADRIQVSSHANLTSAFNAPATALLAATYGYSQFFDPMVRVSDDGTYLEMYFCGAGNTGFPRTILRSTSTNATTWTAPTIAVGFKQTPGSNVNFGEPSFVRFGSNYVGFADGAPGTAGGKSDSVARAIMSFFSHDGTTFLPFLRTFTTSGSDSGSNPYISAYDPSPFRIGNKLYQFHTNSTNTQSGQPTNSDIAYTSANILGFLPGFRRQSPVIGIGVY